MPYVHDTLERLRKSSTAQFEFYQAAEEVRECLRPPARSHPPLSRAQHHRADRRAGTPDHVSRLLDR